MKRRRDRGDGDGDGCFTVVLLILILLSLWGMSEQLGTTNARLKRIIDAVCVEAPPAEPAEEATDDAKGD